MKTFNKSKSTEKIKKQCKELGFNFNDSKYKKGSDYISFNFVHGSVKTVVMFNTVNGTFFGDDEDSDYHFSSNSSALDGTEWFDALLAFVYE